MLSAQGLVGELALAGRLEPHELRRWLESLGIGERTAVLAFQVEHPESVAPLLEGVLARAGAPALVAVCEGLLCAIVDGAERSTRADTSAGTPLGLAARVRRELREQVGDLPTAASRPAPAEALRHSFNEARAALQAARAANGDAPDVASYEELGAVRLLLSLQDGQALASYCHTVLGPVQAHEGDYGEELLRSLDVFIEHNGHWEHAARSLYCHRHTLRYRVRRVEQLTGRDFSHARDRIEFWLALRARELLA